jgi:hypothetical protein
MKTLVTIGPITVALIVWTGTIPCFAGPVIANAGFETPNLGSSYQYDPTGTGVGWIFSAQTNTTGGAGIAANGSGFGVGGPGFGESGSGAPAPQGSQVGFLQSTDSQISQVLSGFTVGDQYSVTFLAAQRPTSTVFGLNTFSQTIEVFLGSVLVGSFTPTSSTAYTSFSTVPITITDDLPHTLTFIGTNAAWIAAGMPVQRSDNTAFIDEVSLSSVPEPSSGLLVATAVLVALLPAASRRVIGRFLRGRLLSSPRTSTSSRFSQGVI